jgi:hypothetical protein
MFLCKVSYAKTNVVHMSVVNQRVKLDPEPSSHEEIRIRIPRKGKIEPSKEQTSFSLIPKVTHIVSFSATTYVPGKICFGRKE